MTVTRRALLLAAAGLPLPGATAGRRSVTADSSRRSAATGAILSPLPQERVALRMPDVAGAIVAPAARARLLASFALGTAPMPALAFAADPEQGSGWLDLVLLVGRDGDGVRIAALELLRWRGAGSHLATRLALDAAGTTLVLQRSAAVRRSTTLWQREAWTDYLVADGGLLRDAPVRPPLAGTWQYRLGLWRARVLAELAGGRREISGRLAALCVPPPLTATPPCATPADNCG